MKKISFLSTLVKALIFNEIEAFFVPFSYNFSKEKSFLGSKIRSF